MVTTNNTICPGLIFSTGYLTKLRTLGKDMKVGVLENLGMPVNGQTLGIIRRRKFRRRALCLSKSSRQAESLFEPSKKVQKGV